MKSALTQLIEAAACNEGIDVIASADERGEVRTSPPVSDWPDALRRAVSEFAEPAGDLGDLWRPRPWDDRFSVLEYPDR